MVLPNGDRHGPNKCVLGNRRHAKCACGALEIPPGVLGRWGQAGDLVDVAPEARVAADKFHTLAWCDGMDGLPAQAVRGADGEVRRPDLAAVNARGEELAQAARMNEAAKRVTPGLFKAFGPPFPAVTEGEGKSGSSPRAEEDSNPCSVPEADGILAASKQFDGSHGQDSNGAVRQVCHLVIRVGLESSRLSVAKGEEHLLPELHVTSELDPEAAALFGHPEASPAQRCTALSAAAVRLAKELKAQGAGVWARQLEEAAARLVAASVGVRQ